MPSLLCQAAPEVTSGVPEEESVGADTRIGPALPPWPVPTAVAVPGRRAEPPEESVQLGAGQGLQPTVARRAVSAWHLLLRLQAGPCDGLRGGDPGYLRWSWRQADHMVHWDMEPSMS